ncbi:MAG: AraC family transcriptional regulator [Lachnospiraceae bacterium]|nr:AraC family transcriptional regulator [Lachnospiraceae bacterium]
MEYYHEQVRTEDGIPARIYYGGSGLDKLRYPLHWHHNLEFDLVLEGCIRGRIGQEYAEVRPGEIFFVNSDELHETDASGETMRSVTVLLSDQLLREYCPDLDSYCFRFEKGSVQQKKLADLILACGEAYAGKKDYYELELSVLLREICLILLRECRELKCTPAGVGKRTEVVGRIKQSITYMEQNYDNPVSIERMGEVMGMTPSYFSRFFRQSTGQTFHSYLMSIRICHAREELEESEKSVTQIAFDCGFPNVKSFIETFKKEYGTTPARYRSGKRN